MLILLEALRAYSKELSKIKIEIIKLRALKVDLIFEIKTYLNLMNKKIYHELFSIIILISLNHISKE